MSKDAFGLSITGASEATLAAFAAYADDFLGYGRTLGRFIAAAEAEPDCPALQAHAAAVHMGLEAAAGFRAARPFLERAEALAPRASERERAFIGAARAWMAGDIARAARLLTETAERWPTDVLAAKWAQYHAFNRGDAALMARAVAPVLRARPDLPFVWGMSAFAKEQLHDLAGAEADARRAMDIRRGDAWAHHALAHVLETQGRLDEGLAFMAEVSDTWADRSTFMREHNWWHVGLFHLDRDEPGEMLALFDRELWGEWPEFGQEQIGAVSALWRTELRGADVGARWEAVSAKVADRELEHTLPFHDLHYVYALARGQRMARLTEFLASMTASAQSSRPDAAVWREVAVPAALALAALGTGDFARGAERLGPLLARLEEIGGSHAQRDLFAQAYIDALARSGEAARAADLLSERVAARPQALGLVRLAQGARQALASRQAKLA